MVSKIQGEGLYLAWDPPTDEIRKRLATFGPRIAAKYLGSALRKAAEPALRGLKAEVKKRGKVTGNLARAVKIKTKLYTRTGNAIALIGFAAVPGKRVPAGGDAKRAFHAGLIEFGTKERTARGPIASSFFSNSPRRSGFKIIQAKRKGKNAKKMFASAKTQPKYPKGFFARASKGQPVKLGSVKVYAPIKRTFEQTRSQCQAILAGALEEAVQNAARDIFSPK